MVYNQWFMKSGNITKVLAIMAAPLAIPVNGDANTSQVNYYIGAVIALFILGYLIYSLLKPDKF
jgi:K+-transporting ATPase KdpF subunit